MAEEEPGEYSREAYEGAETGERKGELHEMAWDEALELNKQYDELWQKKEEAEQAVAGFRRDKLGMGETREEEATPERTRETETKANVEFWQEMGVKVDEADVHAKIEALPEKEGFDFYLYIPKGVKTSEVWAKMGERSPAWKWEGIGNPNTIKSPRANEKDSYVVACHYQQEPDEDTLGENAKSPLDWEKTKGQFMSPIERMVAELRWHKENGTHLDEKNITLSPGSRARDGRVPDLLYVPSRDWVCLNSFHPENRFPYLGVRRVVSNES